MSCTFSDNIINYYFTCSKDDVTMKKLMYKYLNPGVNITDQQVQNLEDKQQFSINLSDVTKQLQKKVDSDLYYMYTISYFEIALKCLESGENIERIFLNDSSSIFSDLLLARQIVLDKKLFSEYAIELAIHVLTKLYTYLPYLIVAFSQQHLQQELENTQLISIIAEIITRSLDQQKSVFNKFRCACDLYAVMLSQLQISGAKLLYYYRSDLIILGQFQSTHLNLIMRKRQHVKDQGNVLQKLYINELIFFVLNIINSRKIDDVINYKIEDEHTKNVSLNYILQLQNNNVFFVHNMITQHCWQNYIYTQLQNFKADLILNIYADMCDQEKRNNYRALSNEFINQLQQEIYVVVGRWLDNKVSFFQITKINKCGDNIVCQPQIDLTQKNYVFQLHESTQNHMNHIEQLCQLLASEITELGLSKLIKTNKHRPLNILISKQEQFKREKLSETRYTLSFWNKQEEKKDELIKLLQDCSANVSINNGHLIIDQYDLASNDELYTSLPHLRNSQMACLILSSVRDLLLIIGAPGTGKTFTTISIIKNFLFTLQAPFYCPIKQQGNVTLMLSNYFKVSFHGSYFQLLSTSPTHQIIVTAHSNNAVDQIANGIIKCDYIPFLFRVGAQSKIMQEWGLDGYIEKFCDELLYLKLIQANYKPTIELIFNAVCKCQQLQHLSPVFKSRTVLQQQLIMRSWILVGTTTGLENVVDSISKFPILIAEEAARMAEYNLVLFLKLAPTKVILVGDVMQLPPLVKDDQLKDSGLLKSLFHKILFMKFENTIVLDEQQRVPTQICNIYRQLYQSHLPKFIARSIRDVTPDSKSTLHYFYVTGNVINETNSNECDLLVNIYRELIQQLHIAAEKISIISYYKNQSRLIEQRCNVKKAYTVDEFQGLENDFIILSLVSQHPSQFCLDINRGLVAFSRARCHLYVVGNANQWNSTFFDELKKLE